jgi:hypothetical protein
MAESKKFYSAKEAALAVLAKTEELLKAHSLAKAAVIPSLKAKAKPEDAEVDPEAEATPGADGAEGEGGSGEGSGGGGGGAAPDEPDNFSTSGKDAKQKVAGKSQKMDKSEEEFGYQLLRKTGEFASGMHNVQYFKLEKTEELFKAIAEADLTKNAPPVGKPDHSNPPKEESAMKPASTHPEAANATPAPENNPHEQAEGNNADWGTSPQVKGHIKLAHFIGHTSAKKKLKQPNSNIGTAMGQPKTVAAPAPAVAPVKKGIALS